MKLKNNYPKIKNDVNKFLKFRKFMILLFFVSILTCVIVNKSVGGKDWMLYVIGAEIIFYYAFLNRPLIDNSFIKKFTIVILIICGYLYLIDLIEKTNWSYFVINIIAFSILIIQLLLFFLAYKSQRKKIIPMFYMSICSIIFCILAISNIVKINWPVIVLGSLGLLVLLILFIFYKKIIVAEISKYFSLK